MLRCHICKREVAPRRENPAFPFCSERCKLIDLGKWLGEEYPDVALEVHHGGQPLYPYLLGIE